MTLQGEYVPSSSQWVRDQVAEYEASGGREANTLPRTGDPIVVITSVGATSGKLRKNPVMRVEKNGTYVAIASKGGAPEDPVWADNFRAHPLVDLQDGPEPRSYTVRELEGEERTTWWEHAVATWSTYASYQEKTDRLIPVFLLEPVA
ncbi:nitroreductase family deazaflavin-dependent oxidoreductase [Nocardioides sp. HDW12B]|uniref:nitroreductase family deazaflavin-dependent oxidoreductase n=1 Tax=Nocardioides sp. HDW12B TaxID=2714939 RepID=UPI0014094A0D|nr:nitroreductase family deazaflavin-dependent oxidoreductase [Nocardioides sp. HDW12B]QIK67215.1 nitroreductase family deazaflavin-dependent oxidoreductase [Nocardioides sp. HDW12B]